MLAGWTGTAHALVLSWDSVAWTPGSLSNSYDVNGDSVNDVTLTMTPQNANIFTNDPTTGTMTPTINQTITGGLSPVQNSLMIAANLHTNSNLTVQISFTSVPLGATDVSFTIFDIDVSTNADIIDSIYGVAPDGTHIAATISNVGSAVDLTGTGLNQVLKGNTASADSGPGSSNGNATISFGGLFNFVPAADDGGPPDIYVVTLAGSNGGSFDVPVFGPGAPTRTFTFFS